MPSNINVARAYKAMKAFGYSSQTIKPVLKKLLNLYDQNWDLIKEDNYKILLDAIIESEEHKGDKEKEQESHLLNEPKEDDPKKKRAYEALKAFGYSQQNVKRVLENLLDLYDQNWQLIEDEQYRVLLDAIIQNEEHKGEKTKPQKSDKSEEHKDGSPGGRYSLRSRVIESSPRSGDLSPSFNEAANQPLRSRGKQKMIESADPDHRLEDDKVEANIPSPHKNDQNAGMVISPNYYSVMELTGKIQLLPGENLDESHPGSREILLSDDGESGESGSVVPMKVTNDGASTVSWEEKNVEHKSNLSKQKNVLNNNYTDATNQTEKSPEDHSESVAPLSVILPGSHYPCGEDISARDGSCLERRHSESKSLVSAEEMTYSLDLSPLDIASSSNGEVKISLTYKSLHGSKFCFPSLDKVSRRMEEGFLEAYGIRQSGFCVKKFMKDFCECFLAAGTIITDDKRVGPENVQPDFDALEKIVSEDVLNGSIDHEKRFCIAPTISLEALTVQNLTEIVPKIPRLQGLNCLELSHCKIDLPLGGAYGEKCLNLKELANLNPSTSSSMMIVEQDQNSSHEIMSLTYYVVEDITRGEENLEVPLINEFNNECQPTFKYIPRNISYQNAQLAFPLARISSDNCCSNCFGDCLSSEIPCACASETGGDFPYTLGGLVKEKFLEDCISIYRSPEPKNLFYCEDCPLERSKKKRLSRKCKGHLFKKFIKECWYKCGCGMKCGNRVVQRGITTRLQVFMTPEGKGWGLRTLEELPKGAFVCEYVGEIVTNSELFERNMKNGGEKYTYPVLLDAGWGTEGVLKDEEALCLDATFYGNIARFINHRCDDANLIEIPVEVESPDHRYYHVAFFTTRKVGAKEELTWDYGIDFNGTHPVKAFKCCCGSPFCRDVKPVKRRRKN